jgi:hypothetical protein
MSFDDDFQREIDEHFRTVRRWTAAGFIIGTALVIGLLGAVGWLAITLLDHFGVI